MNGKALYDKTEGDAEYVAFAVIPAQAGIHLDFVPMESRAKWTPAYAGVTKIVVGQSFDIPQEEFDHAKTLKCSRFETLVQVVIIGRLDYVIDVIRQNLAITWMLIVTVESIVVASGGLGFLIKNSDKFMNHGRIIGLQIIILLIGLGLDYGINFLRKALFRFSKI